MVEGNTHTQTHRQVANKVFFGLYTGKYEPEKTLYLDTFHGVFNDCSLQETHTFKAY